MANSDASSRNPFLVYLLPFLHLGACLAIWIGHIDTGWQKLIIVDFPFSIVLVGLMFREVNPLLSFGILGTLWWYVLSLGVRWLFRAASGRSL
jgi:hypothetical protein